MSHTPHELAEEFPDKVELIRELKMKDEAFRILFGQYHAINRAVHRAETLVEPCGEYEEAAMCKERLRLKDKIAVRLNTARGAFDIGQSARH